MRIQTFSILAGSEACNARCPFCISKMTPPLGVRLREPEVNWRNFRIACRLAERCGVTTAMLTGKGEPTLFPGQITSYLQALAEFQFPIVELQTNGILLIEQADTYAQHLREWYDLGLTTIAVSVVHYLPEKNRAIYLPHREAYIDLPALIRLLHEGGFSVRLACVMADGFIDGRQSLRALIAFAQEHRVEQLTVRPVKKPAKSQREEPRSKLRGFFQGKSLLGAAAPKPPLAIPPPSKLGGALAFSREQVYDWTAQHRLRPEQLNEVRGFLEQDGALLMTLVHGAHVYDVDGQNVCLTDSLTLDAESDDLRQLIFFPDGHLRYDWQYPGAILL
jgi:pyruvate-formate lyase-activating enzyme